MVETGKEKPVIGPSSQALGVLKDGEFSEKKQLCKLSGQAITTRLVIEGVGMAGLEDPAENREWAGMFNHFVKVAGASLQLGRLLQLNGQGVNLQLLLDTVMVSHGGRRQYDEAGWYPNEVESAKGKQAAGDTRIGLSILQGKNLPPELLRTVAVHGRGAHPIIPYEEIKTWNEKLPLYLDFRIAQTVKSLAERFGTKRAVQTTFSTPESHDKSQSWAMNTERELFETLRIASYDTLVKNPKNLKARIETAIKLGKFSEEEASALRKTRLYQPKSELDGDIAGIVNLTHDEFLEKLQLNPDDINERLLQPERWERYIRRLYLNDAEEGIFARLSELQTEITEEKAGSSLEKLEKEFPPDTWWGQYARELYENQQGKALKPRAQKQIGIARAIEFYRRLEQSGNS